MGQSARIVTRYAILVIKGMAYGLTHIVPGIGGGLILLAMGIYEEFVEAVGNLFLRRDRWGVYLPFLGSLGLGMVLSLVVFARIISALAERHPVPMAFFFMGLLVGTIPSVLRLHHDMRLTPGRAVGLVAGLLVVAGFRMAQTRLEEAGAGDLTGAAGLAYNGITSFVAGGASVTPGLDGTYVWMLAGSYQRIIGAISDLGGFVIRWAILVPAGLGAVLGILGFSKGIDALFKRYSSLAYYVVLGLVAGSVYGLWPSGSVAPHLLLAVPALGAGALAAFLLGRAGQGEGVSPSNPMATT